MKRSIRYTLVVESITCLGFNNIGITATKELADALKVNSSLISLALSTSIKNL